MFGAEDVAEIERAIQLAVAPAFLLSGIFSALSVPSGRLARLIDRERAIRNNASPTLPGERGRLVRRVRCTYRASIRCVVAAILLCSLIVTSFGGVFLGLSFAWMLAALLIGAMLSMIAALDFFLTEIHLASHHLPMPNEH